MTATLDGEAGRRLADVNAVAAAGAPGADRLDPAALAAVRDRVAAMVTGAPLPPTPTGGALVAAVAAWGEQLAIDPHGATDADVEALAAAGATPAEIVSLTADLGMADGTARAAALLSALASQET